ncbi:hypothetical protein BDW72DRAFT_188744 [Aspergillus terricola var. indicus]
MTFRSRLRIHNPFHRRKHSPDADARAEVVQAGTVNSLLLPPLGESDVQPNQSTQSMPEVLWSAAYDQLSDEEQRVLSTIPLSTRSNDKEEPPRITLLIDEVIQLTEKHYENFQQKVDGRLRESSRKIINAVLSFKDIISAVATFDPTHHAASAWAIVSLGLTISQNHYDLQVALFEASEYLADVLTQCAYIEDKIYLNSKRDIKVDLGNALVRLYRAILLYTAQIRTAQDPTLGRRLLDCVTAITEHPLTELKASVEKERDNIARWIGLVQYLHHEERSKDILDRVDELLEYSKLLSEQFNLVNLSIAKGAFFDSYVNQHEGFCLPNTRTRLRSQITDWAESSDSKYIFWLNGMAGTGKSTIARTVAQAFKEKQQLGATFFFKKGEADRDNAKCLIPTITKQLVTRHRQLVPGVLKAIKDDPDISAKAIREQFNKLLLQPLETLELGQPLTTVIVIDALDECEREDDINVILELLPQLQKSKSLRVRIFLTSRPELPLRVGFDKSDNHQGLDLHELPNPVIEHDIRLFLKERFLMIRKSRRLTDDWPGDKILDTLVMMAVPLFIFAATACRFIEGGRHPERRLRELLEAQAVTSASQMDKIYQPVLTQFLTDNDDESEELLQEFRDIVGVIIILAAPLSVNSLTRLLHIPKQIIVEVLDPLHSVLNIPRDAETPVRILHLSFRDYLLTTQSKFHVDEQQTHRKIALHCFHIMNDHLKQNICGLSSYGTQKVNIDSHIINQHLSPDLQYSCQYWVHHLQQSQCRISEFPVLPFLRTNLLHWLEALSLIGMLFEAVEMIDMLQEVVVTTDTEISKFLYDARRFVLRNISIVSVTPLQLYHSGLVFSPKKSIVRKAYRNNIPKWICPLPRVEATWSSNLQTLTGHSKLIFSVAFCPDGSTLASGSFDHTIKLWDAKTGKELQTVMGHLQSVSSVAFSSDGLTLASGSYDNTIRLWNAKTGKELQILTGHSGAVYSVAFSSDGSTLASGSFDHTVRLWDTKTGKELQILTGHSGSVNSIAFSSNGSTLASGSSDNTIKLWDVKTGKELQTFTGHLDLVFSVAFSSDGSTVASGLYDNTINLWDVKTGKVLQTLIGHSDLAFSVAFCPDGSTLASGSCDNSIKLWDVKTGKELQTFIGHSSEVFSVAFCSDGSALASGSSDNTIKLWDVRTSKEPQVVMGHSCLVSSVAFSPDVLTLASGSYDKTIKLWDVKTSKELQTLTGHSDWVNSVAFSADGSTLASGSSDNTIKLWDIKTSKELQTLTGHSDWVNSTASLSNGSIHAFSHNNTIMLWDTKTNKELQTLTGHSDLVMSVAFASDGLTLASGSNDHTIKLWDIKTGKELQTLTGHSDLVRSVAFTSDGLTLASGSNDHTIRLWDVKAGKQIQTLTGHSDLVYSVAFSSDGSTLTSGSNDHTIRIWDIKAGRELQTLICHPHSVTFVAKFSPTDGQPILFSPRKSNPTQPYLDTQVSLSGNWVSIAGENLLCIPPEYCEYSCSAVKNLKGATIALGYKDGRVLIMGFPCIID